MNKLVFTLFTLLLTCAAHAESNSFTYTGTGAGSIDGNSFGDSAFIITALADTNARIDCGPGCFYIEHLSASIEIMGVGTFDFITVTRTFAINSVVGFSRGPSGGSGLDLLNVHDLPAGWDMLTNFGPVAGVGEFQQWNNVPVVTSGGVLLFDDGSTSSTFQASVGTVIIDSDDDGVLDWLDNCVLVANGDQRDTDGDGFGNRCDPDFDQNCVVNFIDLNIIAAFFLVPGDFDTDLNGDAVTNFLDISIIASSFLLPPGPSAVTSACDGT